MKYQQGEDSIFVEQRLSTGNVLSFRARNVRRTTTGVHATIFIEMNGKVLDWDTFNVERAGERGRLSNSAHKQFGQDDSAVVGQDTLKRSLGEFCSGLWSEHSRQWEPHYVGGDPDLGGTRYLLKPYVVEGGGTIFYAAPKRGKSYLMMAMGISMDAGVNKFWEVEQAKVMLLNLERSEDSVIRRITWVNEILGLDPRRRILLQQARGRRLSEVMDSARKKCVREGVKAVFVDSISRSGYGSLTDNEPANAIIDGLNSLCSTWVAIGHTAKKTDDSIFGSQMFTAGEDVGVHVMAQKNKNGTLGLGLKMTEANDIPTAPMQVLALKFNATRLINIEHASESDFPELALGPTNLEDEIEEYLLGAHPTSATDIARILERNRSHVARILSKSNRFVTVASDGRTVLYAVRADDRG